MKSADAGNSSDDPVRIKETGENNKETGDQEKGNEVVRKLKKFEGGVRESRETKESKLKQIQGRKCERRRDDNVCSEEQNI